MTWSKTENGEIYIHTIQPVTGFLDHDTIYILTSIKAMSGSENFLALPDEKKRCSVQSFEECRQQQFIKNNAKCGCTPYGHGVVMGNITNQVK